MKLNYLLLSLLALNTGIAAAAATPGSFVYRVPAKVVCPVSGCSTTALRIVPGANLPSSPNTPSTPPVTAPSADARINLSQSSVNFGSGVVGTPLMQVVRLTNSGTTVAPLGTASLTSTQAGFTVQNGCTSTLAGGASCDITLSFTPARRGAVSTDLHLQANGEDVAVSISGTGLQAAGAFTAPTSLDYGSAQVGTSGTMTFKYVNKGDAPATNFNFKLLPGMTVAPTGPRQCGGRNIQALSVEVGGTCDLKIVYTRPTVGTLEGAITLASSSENSPQTFQVTGKSLAPMLEFSTTGLSFPDTFVGSKSIKTLTMKNVSDVAVSPLGTSISAIGANFFNIKASTCGTTLQVGASCSLDVEFTPKSGSPFGESLTISTQLNSQSISLIGQGVSYASLSLSTLNFTGAVGTIPAAMTAVITNTSNNTIESIRASDASGSTGPATFTVNGCSVLAPGQSCTISVQPSANIPATNTYMGYREVYYNVRNSDGSITYNTYLSRLTYYEGPQ